MDSLSCALCTDYESKQESCADCETCKPDWSIRSAIDEAGLTVIGLLAVFSILFYKNYTLQQFMRGLDNINLFGALSFDLSTIEGELDKVNATLQPDYEDETFQKELIALYEEIYNNSKSSVGTLNLLTDKIEAEKQKIMASLKTYSDAFLTKDERMEQFASLNKIAATFAQITQKDVGNRHINHTISIAKAILKALKALWNRFLKRIQQGQQERYLKHSIGVGCYNDKNKKMLLKGEKIPIFREDIFSTVYDKQETVSSPITLGEYEVVPQCKILDTLRLENIPPKPAGEAKNRMEFYVNEYGILSITKTCLETGTSVYTEIDINPYLETRTVIV